MKRSIVLTVVFIVLGAMVLIVWPIVRDVRHARQTELVRNDLKQVMLALHNYHDEHRSFPPAFVVGPDGKRWHSWRSLILKDIDPDLARKYRFDEPWNGPNNSKLHRLAPNEFQSDLATESDSTSHYLAILGKRTVWPADQAVRFRDIGHGTSNTMMLVEHRNSDICWLAPADMMGLDALDMLEQSIHDGPNQGANFSMADGSVKRVIADFPRSLLTNLMTASWQPMYQGDDWPIDLVSQNTSRPLKLPVSTDDLKATTLNAVRSIPIDRNSNHLWCVSLQLAWDELESHLGSPIVPIKPNSTAKSLTDSKTKSDHLSPNSVFLGTSNGSPTADTILQNDIDKRFPDLQYTLQQPSQPVVLRIVCAIQKQMPFAEEFERLAEGLPFQNGKTTSVVENFGYDPVEHDNSLVFEDQISIVDDLGDDNFIVRLKTCGPEEDLIYMGLVPEQSSLQKCWDHVQSRIRSPNPEHTRTALESRETLRIPVLNFSVSQRFPDLEGPVLVNGQTLFVDVAYQDIRLRLDETGADFASVAEVIIGEFGETEPTYNPHRIRQLIFDKPFFVAFQEPNAEEPYFMAWIGNDELMEPMTAGK